VRELVQQLVTGLGVSEQQAAGGAGLIMGLLREQLASADFARLTEVAPGVEGLIDNAPDNSAALGGMEGLLGGVASALGGRELGNIASLAGGFSQLDLDVDMIGRFVPEVLAFFQDKGGQDIADLVAQVLQGN
jgi:hypothetical protein